MRRDICVGIWTCLKMCIRIIEAYGTFTYFVTALFEKQEIVSIAAFPISTSSASYTLYPTDCGY